MRVPDLLPSVLEIIHESEDEAAALGATCRWLRQAMGAQAVAFVSAEDDSVVSAVGWTTGDMEASREKDPRGEGHVSVVGGPVRARAAVRYGGVTIGAVVARGPEERAADLRLGVETAAVLCGPALRARVDAMVATRASHVAMPEIVGRSPVMVELRDAIARAAGAPFSVLIEGESGTGKELAARAIHRLSTRRDRRFCAVNCAALSDELIEAELFGHTRGAFTGAIGPRTGLFEEAHGGTLFLDEVGELSARAQAKLLRVLQEGEVRRVGENAPRRVDVRIVAATNRALADLAEHGAFRDDLVFRLAVARIRMPPLRDRVEDIPVLALSFWKQLTLDVGKRAILGADALAALCHHRWPGNVRELQNALAGLAMLAPARGRVGARHVQQVLTDAKASADDTILPLDAARLRWEQRTVAGALARRGGRRSAAARDLGLTRQGLSKAMKRLGLERESGEGRRGVA